MPPFLFIFLAILTPFGFVVTLFAPIYLSVFAAAYLVYRFSPTPASLAEKFTDVFYIIDVYYALFEHWRYNMFKVDLLTYTLPVILIPFIGFYFALWLTRRFIRKVGDIFHFSHHG